MTIENIITLIGIGIGGLGLGGIITNVVNSFYIGRAEKRKLLFEARTKAYSSLVGKIQNGLLPDLLEIKSHMRSYEYNSIFSEVTLLSSKELHTLLKDYSRLADKFYAEIAIAEGSNLEHEVSTEVKTKFREKSEELIELMRRDLYIVT